MEKDPFKEILNRNFQQEVPSFDFTQQVMQKVEHAAENRTIIEPLIPKSVFWLIGAFYSIVCFLPIVTGMQESTLLFLDQINSIGFNSPNMKQNLQLIFTITFVFTALTLTDMLFKSKGEQSIKLLE